MLWYNRHHAVHLLLAEERLEFKYQEVNEMKYEGVCIAVKDVERSKRFYQELFELEVF